MELHFCDNGLTWDTKKQDFVDQAHSDCLTVELYTQVSDNISDSTDESTYVMITDTEEPELSPGSGSVGLQTYFKVVYVFIALTIHKYISCCVYCKDISFIFKI